MNTLHEICTRVLVLSVLAGASACGASPEVEGSESESDVYAQDPSGRAPVVRGTVLEASSGKPLPGVLVEGPGGTQAETDSTGRFVLRGLSVGMEGELRATAEGGLSGRNRLRPLKAGELEVVIYLR